MLCEIQGAAFPICKVTPLTRVHFIKELDKFGAAANLLEKSGLTYEEVHSGRIFPPLKFLRHEEVVRPLSPLFKSALRVRKMLSSVFLQREFTKPRRELER